MASRSLRCFLTALTVLLFAGCSDNTPSEAKVQLDLQDFVESKLGTDLLLIKVLDIVDKDSAAEDRITYKVQIRWEADEEKIKAFIATLGRNAATFGGYPDLRAVEFAHSMHGKEEAAEVLFRKAGERWNLEDLGTMQ